ncbi:MAG: hypothetical protein NTW14_07940 [bacterium]|nr:hypothetical protein [bacterium]
MTYRSVFRALLALVLLGALGIFMVPQPVDAVWHIVLSERFAGSSLTWPWGNWTINPNRPPTGSGPPYSWGVQDTYYKFNGMDTHSLWCCGQPNSLDPFQDNYPPGTVSWAKWGPINLSQAVAAQANFWFYCKTEPVQDYFRWGAYPSNTFNMYEYDRRSGVNTDWLNGFLDFDSLAGGTQSMLGQGSVYIVFQFVADGDNQVNVGAFLDEVNIAWDDGMLDLEAKSPFFQDMDSTTTSTATWMEISFPPNDAPSISARRW